MAKRLACVGLLGLLAACPNEDVDGTGKMDAMVTIDAAGEPVDAGPVQPATCSQFQELAERWWSGALPHIAPTSGIRIYVEGTDFIALWGASSPQLDEGTTLVWGPKEFVFEDGTRQLGAVGSRMPNATECEWVTPVSVEQP